MSKSDNAKPGCFSGFLHALLRDTDVNRNSPPQLHTPDHITQSHVTEILHQTKEANDAAVVDHANTNTPGVIARLMGLDSLPDKNTNLVTTDSVPRSRSLSFVDYMLRFDDTNRGDNRHCRAKTSASFREVPELFRQNNRDHVVFESKSRKQETRFGHRKKKGNKNKEIVRDHTVTVLKEMDQAKKNKKISNLKNEPRVVPAKKNSSKARNRKDAEVLASDSACSKNCSGHRKSGSGSRSSSRLQNKRTKEVLSEPKQTKNTRKQRLQKKIVETEFGSEDLSPVSVLDINDYTYLYGPDFLDYTSHLVSKSKWESSEFLFLGDGGVEDRASKNEGCYANPDINREEEFFAGLELKLRALTENDMKESGSTRKRACEAECCEEVSVAFEHRIFEILLNEVVNELVELSC